MELLGIAGAVSAGIVCTVVCRVVGARPSADVSFWLDGKLLDTEATRPSRDANVTETKLFLTPAVSNQGRDLTCRAETPGLLVGSLEDSLRLQVHCEWLRKNWLVLLLLVVKVTQNQCSASYVLV